MQKAVYRSGVYEGNFFSDYWHEECYDVAPAGEEFDPHGMVRGKDEPR